MLCQITFPYYLSVMPKIKEKKPSVFAKRLIELRKARQLTQAQLAEKLGMSTSGIAYYEATAGNPRLTTIKKIADFFQVSPEYLLSSDDGPKKRGPSSRVDKIADELRGLSIHKQREACHLVEILIQAIKG